MAAKRRKSGSRASGRRRSRTAEPSAASAPSEPAVTPADPQKADEKKKVGFLPDVLDRTVIAMPLLNKFKAATDKRQPFHVAIDLNLNYKGGLAGARKWVIGQIHTLLGKLDHDAGDQRILTKLSESRQYVYATLEADVIKDLVRSDNRPDKRDRAIYHIWPDFDLRPLMNKSISTVKGDAAHNAFAALGAGIVWAVIDSGIDAKHPHFKKHKNLKLDPPLVHKDFTPDGGDPLQDAFGHGTHVAGIIAGEVAAESADIWATVRYRNEDGEPTSMTQTLDVPMTGMAPRCKLLSLKVLDDDGKGNGTGRASSIMAALQYIQELNGDGRRLLVHGVNLSVGYDFDPEWFACGQSPLCTEVDRLVRSGVVVVVAAGNSGYGFVQSEKQGVVAAGLDLTINDPGNSDLAITVGSTHRDMPHTYGVSYFSSKGPTGDGRMKPDLLAPGEKILSCASQQMRQPPGSREHRMPKRTKKTLALYREDSGTSMAAPHVSGVIAAFLSIRREYEKHPDEIKKIFLSTATDLGRAPYFQGRGLVDAMRAIQSV